MKSINIQHQKGAHSTTYNFSNNTTVNRGKNWTNTTYNSTGTNVKELWKQTRITKPDCISEESPRYLNLY